MNYHDSGRRSVNLREVKKIICVIFMMGFFAGIIYMNIFARSYLLSMGIFEKYFLEEYAGNKLNTASYMWYVVKNRVCPLVLLSILLNTRFGRIAGCIFLGWTGFASGMILTTAVFKLGIKGILLCVVGVLPHFVCYITVYIMLFSYMFRYPEVRWNTTKTVSIVLFVLLGIITEVYINPVLMDIYIKMI